MMKLSKTLPFLLVFTLAACGEPINPEDMAPPPFVTGVFQSSSISATRARLVTQCETIGGDIVEANAEGVVCTVEFNEFETNPPVLMTFGLERLGADTVAAAILLMFIPGIEGLVEMSGETVTDMLSEYLRDAGADAVALVEPL